MAQVLAVPLDNLRTSAVTQRYFAFILKGADGTLALNTSVDGGATWLWKPLGSPPAGVLSFAAATSFFSGNLAGDGSTINQFYTFVVANDGHLWVTVSLDDGKTWNWQDQGTPPSGATISGGPEAVSQQAVHSSSFEQDVYCHVIGNDGHLYVNFSVDNGKTFQWADRGTPSTTTLAPGQASRCPTLMEREKPSMPLQSATTISCTQILDWAAHGIGNPSESPQPRSA